MGDFVAKSRQVKGIAWIVLALLVGFEAGGCARVPFFTGVVHEDARVSVKLQQEVKGVRYTHPVKVTDADLAKILAMFSIREHKTLPLALLTEDEPPAQLFRKDERDNLAPHLAAALQKAGPQERVHFEIYAPAGPDPRFDRDVTAGWLAVRDAFLHLAIELFHKRIRVPAGGEDPYYLSGRYPSPLPSPESYDLYFEPVRFWVTDPQSGAPALDFRNFLKALETSSGNQPAPPSPQSR